MFPYFTNEDSEALGVQVSAQSHRARPQPVSPDPVGIPFIWFTWTQMIIQLKLTALLHE